jgi:hypothetical protein
MNLYWVYDLPNWLFGTLTIAITEAIGLGGLCATRKWVQRIHGTEHSHNEVVRFYLSAICVFYGITLAKPKHARLDGRHVLRTSRSADLSARRYG